MKTVFVTGVSRGLGLAIARLLAGSGFRVVGLGRTLSDGYVALMAEYPDAAFFETLDVSAVAAIADTVRPLLVKYKPVFGLVNNAGIGLDGVLATQHQKDIDAIIATNLVGAITLTKYVSRSMLSNGAGRIVNISSIIASTGFSGLAVYAASKAGLEGFTRALSREVGKRGVTVNCVAPGFMETEMTSGLKDEKMASITRRTSLGLPDPIDAAYAVLYLLGPGGAKVTGTVLTVDGGSTA